LNANRTVKPKLKGCIMAHELELNENGEARMFYAGQKPWHGLGQEVETELTSAGAIRLGGLDWDVEKRELYFQAGDAVQHIADKKAIVRLEDERILGIVNKTYEMIQNSDAFEFLDGLVGEGLAMYHTAGSLFGGKRIFICCKLPETFKVADDVIEKYLVAMTSHDGSTAFHIKWTPIRVVCNNTLSMAFDINSRGKVQTNQDVVSIRHTKNFKDGLEQARGILKLSEGYYDRVEAVFNQLLATPMSEAEYQSFSEQVIPKTFIDEDGKVSKVGETLWQKKQDELLDCWHNGIGLDGLEDTKWKAYNAVTEYADHRKKFAPKKNPVADARMNSVIWGHSAELKKKAVMLLS